MESREVIETKLNLLTKIVRKCLDKNSPECGGDFTPEPTYEGDESYCTPDNCKYYYKCKHGEEVNALFKELDELEERESKARL